MAAINSILRLSIPKLGIVALMLFCISFFLLSSEFSSAYVLKDSMNHTFIEEVIEVSYPHQGTVEKMLKTTDLSGNLDISVPPAADYVDFRTRTMGSIYFARSHPNSKVVSMKKIASLSAYIMDDKENLLKDVLLRISCTEPYSALPNQTDELGQFSIDSVGFGRCTVNAVMDRKMKSFSIELNESRDYVWKIVINDRGAGSMLALPYLPYVLIALLLIFAVGLSIYLRKRVMESKAPKAPKAVQEESSASAIVPEEGKAQLDKRQNDIIRTLSENEAKIVDFLINHECTATQSQIRHGTGIPKATLHRHVSKLVQKQIAKVEECGKLKKVMLTGFFLKG